MKLALGVSGCIADDQAAELVRLLQQEVISVHVLLTNSAQAFVGPLTLAVLTVQQVFPGI